MACYHCLFCVCLYQGTSHSLYWKTWLLNKETDEFIIPGRHFRTTIIWCFSFRWRFSRQMSGVFGKNDWYASGVSFGIFLSTVNIVPPSCVTLSVKIMYWVAKCFSQTTVPSLKGTFWQGMWRSQIFLISSSFGNLNTVTFSNGYSFVCSCPDSQWHNNDLAWHQLQENSIIIIWMADK